MKWDRFDYKVADHFLSAIINADDSGLNDEEARQLQEFQANAYNAARADGFTVGHWDADTDQSEDWGRCAITGLHAMRSDIKLMVYKKG